MIEVNCFDSPQGNSIDTLTQWDTNQAIYIKNWNYEVTPIFHFTNIKKEIAKVVRGEIVDGCAKATIPNKLLQEPYTIFVYVYLEDDFTEYGLDDDAYGKTVYFAKIPVRKKAVPHDYNYQESNEYISWVRLEREMRHRIEKLVNYSKKLIGEYETALEQLEVIRDKAKEAAANAKASESNSSTSEKNAKVSETNAKISEENAKISESNASTSEINSSNSALLAQSYAIGGTNTRKNEETTNSKYYYLKTKAIKDNINGIFSPMGTIKFSQLANVEKDTGYMYHISNDFITDDTFKCGAGLAYYAGTNVYYTADGYWDCLTDNADNANDIENEENDYTDIIKRIEALEQQVVLGISE